ncbi:hypothetical protein [Pseudomonas guariconensis]|uniref:Uncharacterized protein n=1 Tax=Pseudomonas guariconensis TaxID=1288410 RepID=A0AAX0VVX4_9PSED|nr:hypothetical protein [Pseudomonas guariconensis]PLV18399.1 hypothetical protein CXG49_15050 [Pseudomonas guariconensis]PLV23103.1 hypothetical protein CXG53_15765 [Pseudomonas guariconensis]PLV28253.1 hypothetical protein CXG51_16935 [Pseudomonas guariconensis]
MSTDEIRELLLDLQRLGLETEQAEQAILRKAQERLGQLPETPSSEIEKRLLRGVIYRAEAALGLKNQIE